MHRNGLIFLGALLLVLAIVFCFRMTGTPAAGADGALVVRVYPVPTELGDDIRKSLQTVMFAHSDGETAVGQATLTQPGQLMVSAPDAMHSSIARSIEALSANVAPEARVESADAPVAIELWIVGIDDGAGADDPGLAPAQSALDAARSAMSLGHFVRLQRATAVGGDGSHMEVRTDTLKANFELRSSGQDVVLATVRVNLSALRRLEGEGPRFEQSGASFTSRIPLRLGQWQVVGLLSGQSLRGDDTPDRLLLLRATRLEPAGS